MSALGYRKRKCPKCKKSSFWYGNDPLSPELLAAIEMLSCSIDIKKSLSNIAKDYQRQADDIANMVLDVLPGYDVAPMQNYMRGRFDRYILDDEPGIHPPNVELTGPASGSGASSG